MKRTLLSVVLLTALSFSSFAGEKAVFDSKDQFHQTCDGDHFCTAFTIDLKETDTEFLAFSELVNENSSIISYTLDNGLLTLRIKASTADVNAYSKIFYLLGIETIEVKEGTTVSAYSSEDFLNKYL